MTRAALLSTAEGAPGPRPGRRRGTRCRCLDVEMLDLLRRNVGTVTVLAGALTLAEGRNGWGG